MHPPSRRLHTLRAGVRETDAQNRLPPPLPWAGLPTVARRTRHHLTARPDAAAARFASNLWAIRCSVRSPAMWPSRSFKGLKKSRSSNTTPSAPRRVRRHPTLRTGQQVPGPIATIRQPGERVTVRHFPQRPFRTLFFRQAAPQTHNLHRQLTGQAQLSLATVCG